MTMPAEATRGLSARAFAGGWTHPAFPTPYDLYEDYTFELQAGTVTEVSIPNALVHDQESQEFSFTITADVPVTSETAFVLVGDAAIPLSLDTDGGCEITGTDV